MKKQLVIFLCLTTALFAKNITEKEAVKMTLVMSLEKRTQHKVKDHISRAIANNHWQNAMQELRYPTKTMKYGKKTIPTIDYAYAMKELEEASRDDILLAAYQGYVLASSLGLKMGKVSKKNTAKFASYLTRWNICEGYYDLATAYAEGWIVEKEYNYKKALSILENGREICNHHDAPFWQKREWGTRRAKYAALLKQLENKTNDK